MGSAPSMTEGQRATLSPEAATYLRNLKTHIPFAESLAPFLTTPYRIPNLRETLAKRTAPIEEALIKKHNIAIKRVTIADVPVVIITPANIKPENEQKMILNIFGGGFVMGSARNRTGLIMAVEMGIRVYSIDYALAPEARYPIARDQCLAAYRQLIKDFDPKNILGMSSSAGGQLMLSALLMARNENLPMIAGLYFCTPATDLSGAGDSLVANAKRDLMPTSLLIGMVRQNYQNAEVDVRDPLYSPVYAEYDEAFPPTVISVGTRDVMLSSGVRLYWKLRDAGVKVDLLVSEGMWHGFNWEEDVPEAVQARGAVRRFLDGCWGRKGPVKQSD